MALQQEQNDNLLEDNSSETQEMSSSDFFNELDRQVNGAVLDSAGETVQRDSVTASNSPREESVDKQGHNYEKRYKDSSREATKLKGRLDELEPYAPILDDMREDPNLISHIKGYYEGGGSTPGNLKERLGLDEDFVFDYDEAVDNPDSDSGKLLNSTIDGVVQKRLGQFAEKSKEESQRISAEQDFRSRHQLSDDQFQQVVQFAQSRPLTYDDIYYLMNKGKKDNKIAQNTKGEMMDQMKKVREKPSSAASSGSSGSSSPGSNDDRVFNSLIDIDKEMEQAFSL
jgi:hypothetical protein|tara:strand:+ start:1928 stop:2782 length:855 start_codon:yes stop_codon:yes gene_type:complete